MKHIKVSLQEIDKAFMKTFVVLGCSSSSSSKFRFGGYIVREGKTGQIYKKLCDSERHSTRDTTH